MPINQIDIHVNDDVAIVVDNVRPVKWIEVYPDFLTNQNHCYMLKLNSFLFSLNNDMSNNLFT